jgi:4-diphosphocytidyl-2-C-methyl-D-erythritol kinase
MAGRHALRWWPAPAKLNLFLQITGRRSDGYHNLQTVFQLLDWCDDIGIETSEDGLITRSAGPADIPPETDLAVCAARALARVTGCRHGVRLNVRKRIPTGGGLGGGSSDAATVLLVLNRLWGTGLTPAELAGIGLTLGADVPVFVYGSSAWGEGRGEQLVPFEPPERWFVIIHPGVAVSTAEIFQAPELTRNSPLITIRALSTGTMDGTRNDCEPVVRARYPAVAEAIEWLSRSAPARLTGTGSCVFAAFERASDAERVAARVPEVWTSRVARGVVRSPLLEAMNA